MSLESPYQISIPSSQIDLLKQKLSLTTFPDELEDSAWIYGAPLEDVKRLVSRWKDGYDWRIHECHINQSLPQFTRDIDVEGHGSLNIHYVHKKSAVDDAIPLLFAHGWPGSFLEVEKILPLLTEPSEGPSFHVVALSLPGFGFSEAPRKKGFAAPQYAEVMNKLMLSLGYDEYVTQGGDWGFFTTRFVARIYGSKHAKAWHTNYAFTRQGPSLWTQPIAYLTHILTPYTKHENAGMKRMEWFINQGKGYNIQQSTQPQTIGYSLADSPAGLLAWIFEKLHNWSDDYPWTDDEILTWVSMYWFSRAGPVASVRIYYEFAQGNYRDLSPSEKPTIPLGASLFPKELRRVPKTWLVSLGNLVYLSKEHDKGGHFAAHERPKDLVDDLREMFGKGGPAFGVVSGKDGYSNGTWCDGGVGPTSYTV